MKTSINVLFKSMQKDDKKEILKFEIKGAEDVDGEAELFDLSGSIVTLSMTVGGDDVCGEITSEFVSMQRDSKKTVMKFGIKGDSEEKALQLYKFAGRNVTLNVAPSQMSLEEFNEAESEEFEDENQLTLDEAMAKADDPMAGVDSESDVLPY